MARPCSNPVCDNSLSEANVEQFCFTCLAALHRQKSALYDEVDKTLSLEAEFVQWCEAHGHPHPHQ